MVAMAIRLPAKANGSDNDPAYNWHTVREGRQDPMAGADQRRKVYWRRANAMPSGQL